MKNDEERKIDFFFRKRSQAQEKKLNKGTKMILASDQNRFDFEYVEQNVRPVDVLGGARIGPRNCIHFLVRGGLGHWIQLPMSLA